jgi:plastocyanin
VKDGLDPEYAFETPTTPVVIDQKGCVYTPRVVGVRVGQPIEVVNSDPTLHNVHALPMVNQEFNQGQPVQYSKLSRTFTAPEVMVRFKCDVHSWMAAWVGVVAHPYFAVTGADGSFQLPNLPPGTYTLEAWHEKLGPKTAKVTVAAGQTQAASFTFSAVAK